GSPVAAVSRNPDHVDVFWIGPDGAVGSTWWDRNGPGPWATPFPITRHGAASDGRLDATGSDEPHHGNVFWIGPDGAVGSTWWDRNGPGPWATPFPITPPGAARDGSPVAAVSRNPDHVDVFWIGPDGAVGSTWWDRNGPGPWATPFPITRHSAANASRLDAT